MSPIPEITTPPPSALRTSRARSLSTPSAGGGCGVLPAAIQLELVGSEDLAEHLRGSDDSVADRRDQAVGVLVRKLLEHRVEAPLAPELADRQPQRLELVLEDRIAQLDRSLGLQRAKPLADSAFGPRRNDVIQPVLARVLAFGRDRFDRVARLELVAQRHHPAVHARARQMLPDHRMNPVGEIDHGRAGRKIKHLALGRENENLGGKEVVLDGREELLRVFQILLPFDQAPQPCEPLGIAQALPVTFLVGPVRRDSLFGHAMHLARANLHFHPLPARPDHRGVQRLVHVDLGQRDIVLESPRHRLPVGVHDAERLVTFAHRLDDDPEGDQVVDLVEGQPFVLHLGVDRIEMLVAAGDFGVHAGALQPPPRISVTAAM